MDDIKEEVYGCIEKIFKIGRSEIQDDTSLLSLGSVYSVGMIAMINFIEDNYNIIVEDADISEENFGTVNSIVSYISRNV